MCKINKASWNKMSMSHLLHSSSVNIKSMQSSVSEQATGYDLTASLGRDENAQRTSTKALISQEMIRWDSANVLSDKCTVCASCLLAYFSCTLYILIRHILSFTWTWNGAAVKLHKRTLHGLTNKQKLASLLLCKFHRIKCFH